MRQIHIPLALILLIASGCEHFRRPRRRESEVVAAARKGGTAREMYERLVQVGWEPFDRQTFLSREYEKVAPLIDRAPAAKPPSCPPEPTRAEVFWAMAFAERRGADWHRHLAEVLHCADDGNAWDALVWASVFGFPKNLDWLWQVLAHTQSPDVVKRLWGYIGWSLLPYTARSVEGRIPKPRHPQFHTAPKWEDWRCDDPEEVWRLVTREDLALEGKWRFGKWLRTRRETERLGERIQAWAVERGVVERKREKIGDLFPDIDG